MNEIFEEGDVCHLETVPIFITFWVLLQIVTTILVDYLSFFDLDRPKDGINAYHCLNLHAVVNKNLLWSPSPPNLEK